VAVSHLGGPQPPDHRDTALLEDDGPVSFRTEMRRQLANHLRGRIVGTKERVGLRLAYRIFTGVLLVGLMLVAIAEFPPLAVFLALAVLAYFASARNVVGHVVVAASEPSQLNGIRSRVRDCIDWTLDRCDQVVVVAHSQGGFVCHSILDTAAEPPPPKRVRGLIGVGSGLKPIWLLQQLNRPKIAAAVWITTVATAIGEASMVALLSGADPTLTAAARGLIDLGAYAALPIAALSAVSVQEASAFVSIDAIPLIGLPDSFWHPGVLPIIGVAAFSVAGSSPGGYGRRRARA
jgi:pimeloyl-ACP methyl ester carboxylesterase